MNSSAGFQNVDSFYYRTGRQKGKPKCVDEILKSESHVEIGKEMKTFSASRYV